MASLPLKLMGSIGVLAVVLAAAVPADAAKARKHKKPTVVHAATVSGKDPATAAPICFRPGRSITPTIISATIPIHSSACSCSATSAPITAANPDRRPI